MTLSWKQSAKAHNRRIHAFVDGVPYCPGGKASLAYGNTFVDFEVVPGLILGRMCAVCFNRFLRVPPKSGNGKFPTAPVLIEESPESRAWRAQPKKPKPAYIVRFVENRCGCLGTSGNLPPMPNCQLCKGSGTKRDKIRELAP